MRIKSSVSVTVFLTGFHWITRWGSDEQRKVPHPLTFIYVKWCSSGVPSTASWFGTTVLCWCPALTTGQIAQGGQEMKCPSPGVNPSISLWCCSWRNPVGEVGYPCCGISELMTRTGWSLQGTIFSLWFHPDGVIWSMLSICLTFWVIGSLLPGYSQITP